MRVKTFYSYDYTPYTIRNESISVGVANDDEPNDVYASAVTFPLNSSTEGHVGYYNSGERDVYDWYKITTTQDGNLTLTLEQTLAQYTWIYLYDSDGSTLLESGYSLDTFSISRNDLAAGTYYVRINMFYTSSGYTGYTLTNTLTTPAQANDNEPNDVYTTANAFQTNSSTEGHVGYYNSGARDVYDCMQLLFHHQET